MRYSVIAVLRQGLWPSWTEVCIIIIIIIIIIRLCIVQ